MRILLSACACCPGRGSEPGVGWHWACLLARRHEVHVLTAPWSREAIERDLAETPRAGLHFHYVPELLPRASVLPLGLGWLHHGLWQRRAARLAARLHAETPFDLAHQVGYASWRSPSFLWRLGIPLVWGPVGGGQRVPPGFLRVMGWRGALRERMRDLVQRVFLHHPSIRTTFARASAILVANTATREFLPPAYREKARLLLETGLEIAPGRPRAPGRDRPHPFRVLWVGQLVPLKGLPLLLRALARVPAPSAYAVTVIGAGPEEKRWRALAARLGVADRIAFAGGLPYDAVQERYLDADAFVFTSLRETSGNVVLEAMAAALPVVCLDWSGPRDLTTDETALRLAPADPETVVGDLARALETLRGDAALRRRLGEAGRRRVAEVFSWRAKAEVVEAVYRGVTDGS